MQSLLCAELGSVIYEDPDAELKLTKLEDLNRMGRYKIVAGQELKVLDLASGIGTALMGIMEAEAGFRVLSYTVCEVDPVSRGILKANSFIYGEKYSGRLGMAALKGLEDLPQDLFVLSRQAGQLFAKMSELPDLVLATVPCTECSVAGLGRGASTPRGQLFRHAATVVGRLMEEYHARRLWDEGMLAPCGWIFETAPMKTQGHEGAVERLQAAYSAVLGRRTWDDDGQKGGTSRRLTEMYTNLGQEEDWESLNSRGRKLPVVPIRRLLRPGEKLQVWDSKVHGPAVWPNVNGLELRVWPKFVRSSGSHQYRATLKRKATGSLPQWKMAVGVSMWRGQPTIPSAEMQEQALGLWPGYTAVTVCNGQASRLEPKERLPRLGDVWGRNLISATLDDRVRSSLGLKTVPPSSRQFQSRNIMIKPVEGHHRQSETWDERDQDYQEGVAEDQQTEWDLETEFVKHKAVLIVPPGRAERVKPPPSTVRPVLEIGSPEEQKARAQLSKVLKWMEDRSEGRPPPPEALLPDGDFSRYIKEQLSNPEEQFMPGNLHPYRRIWREYLENTLGSDVVKKHRKVQAFLTMLEKGVQGDWAPLDRPPNYKHPKHDSRQELVKEMLVKVYGPEKANQLLLGDTPGRVRLPNLRSVHEKTTWYDGTTVDNADFVTESIKELTESGRLAEWHWPDGQPPQCILPLGIATRELEKKLRLIFDGRYINLWCKYYPFKYEGLKDVLNYAEQGGWATISDYKAGYHHLACPDLSQYLGICWQGTVYVWTCIPFGYAPACRIFTEVTNIMYRPVREAGVNLTSYIDDRASVSSTRTLAKWDALIQFGVMAMCGWFVNFVKSAIDPVQLFRFLGLDTDLVEAQFRVPEERMKLMLLQIDRALSGKVKLTPKEVCSIAGRVGSTRMAVPVAPLLCWDLHKSMGTKEGMMQLTSGEGELRAALQFLKDNLEGWNGSSFWKKQGGLVFAGDAGEMGSGGISLTGDLDRPIQVSYTEAQLARIRSHELHSTIREVLNVLMTLQCLVEQIPALISGKRLMYLTDSQAAFYAVMSLRAKQKETINLVYEIWSLCRRHDIDLTVRWCSRWEPHMLQADTHTRMVDNTAWGLKPKAFSQVLADLGLQASDIQLDVFSQADMRKAERWYSLYNAPGSAGVDGFLQRWAKADGEKAFCWINGPFHLMGRIIAKLKEERADGVLICPKWPKAWRAQLKTLPIVKTVTVKQPLAEGRKVSPFWPGARVSPEARNSLIYWTTEAHLVRWA